MEVTATAVRQRLVRLLAQGYIERTIERAGRGRPGHRYSLTEKGRRKTGANFADLAVALWDEIRSIKDVEVRRGLFARLSRRMAEMYADQIEGETIHEKMQAVSALFADKEIPFSVTGEGELPVLTALGCPYPELAEQDRGICAVERMMFSELLGEDVRLTHCRLDGEASCCTFQPVESLTTGSAACLGT
jgi:predicted ArsR family transcriptional regulator